MFRPLFNRFLRLPGSLKWRIAAACVAALALGIGLTATVLVRDAESDTMQAREHLERSEATRTAHLLGMRVQAHQQALAAAATQLDPALLHDEATRRQFLQNKPVLLPQFTSVFVVDGDGRMLALQDGDGYHAEPKLNLADREYVRRAFAEQRAVVSEPIVSRLRPEPAIVMAQPLQRGAQTVGLLAAGIRLKTRDLLAGVSEAMAGDEGVLVVVSDVNGRVLAHPDGERIGSLLSAEPRLAPAFRRWQNEGRTGAADGPGLGDAERLVAEATVPGTQWLVWRSRLRADVLAPLVNARHQALRWAFGIVTGLGIGLVLLLGNLLRPLALLRKRAQRLFDDALDPQAGWPGATGEIGQVERVLRHVAAERAQLEAFNHQVIRQLESVMAAAPVGIAFTRAQRFEMVSRQFCLILGREESTLLGQPTQQIYASNEDFLALGPRVGKAFAAGQPYDGELRMLRADGSTFWGRMRGQPVDWQDAGAGTIWTVHDASEEVAKRQVLEWSATHDLLTGLANRKAFEQRLAQVFAARPSSRPAALVLFDLDRFKPINDSCGHAAGDAMLRAVAAAATARVRASDLLVRLGGDEFAIVLEHCTPEVACRVAEDVGAAVAEIRLPWEDRVLEVGASFGVAALTDDLAEPSGWIRAADEACYEAKASGRGRVHLAGVPALRLVKSV